MSHDKEWFTTLLRRWTALTPEVRGQLQVYMQLAPGDRKNHRRLEKKLKIAAYQLETFHHAADGRKASP
jgi:hypothetical protein